MHTDKRHIKQSGGHQKHVEIQVSYFGRDECGHVSITRGSKVALNLCFAQGDLRGLDPHSETYNKSFLILIGMKTPKGPFILWGRKDAVFTAAT